MTTHRRSRVCLARRFTRVACIGLCCGMCVGAICGGLAGCTKTVNDTDIVRADLPAVRRITESTKADNALFVDARSSEAFRAGHIPGAVNVRLTDLPADGSRLPENLAEYTNLIVYGEDPGSAAARGVAKRLMLAGHKGVYWYDGGIADWKRSGRELAK